MAKPKAAFYWCASCGGCDVAVLDTNEKILDIDALAEDASIIKFVNQMVSEAIKDRATDIHLEPFQNELRVRFSSSSYCRTFFRRSSGRPCATSRRF